LSASNSTITIGRKKALQYLIKWKGYPSSDNTWEPETNVSSHQRSSRTTGRVGEQLSYKKGRTLKMEQCLSNSQSPFLPSSEELSLSPIKLSPFNQTSALFPGPSCDTLRPPLSPLNLINPDHVSLPNSLALQPRTPLIGLPSTFRSNYPPGQ